MKRADRDELLKAVRRELVRLADKGTHEGVTMEEHLRYRQLAERERELLEQ